MVRTFKLDETYAHDMTIKALRSMKKYDARGENLTMTVTYFKREDI